MPYACPLSAALAIATLSLALPASAEQPLQLRKANARQLAHTGIDAIDTGDCNTGLQSLEQAEALYHSLVHQRYIAFCKAQAGEYIAATEVWREMLREGAPANASAGIQLALESAETGLAQTLPKLAETVLRLHKPYPDLKVQFDGSDLDSSMIGSAIILDPGEHKLIATATGYELSTYTWNLESGTRHKLEIELSRKVDKPAATEPAPDTALSDPVFEESSSSPSWLSLSLMIGGGVALAGGSVAWYVSETKLDDLHSACGGDDFCDGNQYSGGQSAFDDESDSIEIYNTAANVLFIGGGVLALTGLSLYLFGDGDDTAPQVGALWVPGHGAFHVKTAF
ncbi:MAG: hypothetical protein HRU17_20525 [Polyangiaceae bacterium]|nr:hypothetical protein [Polyangiaceae bacterium]